jgi:inner membrane protein YidH
MAEKPDRARDHLANERTFLAWVRTGVAIVVFGFAIGRFSIAIRQLMQLQGRTPQTPGLSVWLGTLSIVAGVALTFAGLLRYRKTREQIDTGTFQPSVFLIDMVMLVVAVLGLAMAGYLVYTEQSLR